MAGIFGDPNAVEKPTYTSIQLQTSAAGLPIPIVYGQNRLGSNLVQYENFNTLLESTGGGKGGLGGSSSGQYHYTADVVLGVCEGVVSQPNLVWNNGQVTALGEADMVGFIFEEGTNPQAPFGFLTVDAPARALGYQDTAVAGCQSLDLGTSPTLPQFEWELLGFFAGTDAYAPPPALTTLTVGVTSGDGALQVAECSGIYPGMTLEYVGQTPLDLNGKPLNTPYYVEVLGVSVASGPGTVSLSSILTDIVTVYPAVLTVGYAVTFKFLDINPRNVLYDLLTTQRYGLGWSNAFIGDLTYWGNYCRAQGLFLSPVYDHQEQLSSIIDRIAQATNSWIFYDGTQIQAVPLADADVTNNGQHFKASLQAAYDLTYDDFIFEAGNMPVEVDRTDPSDAYNEVRVEINDRVNKAYQANPVEAKDEGMIGLYGQVNSPSIQGRDICSPTVGNTVVNLLLARYVYIRNEYRFKLGPEFSLLQVGDIVTITEPHIGLSLFPVRIKQVEEDDKMVGSYTAEEVPGGAQVVPVGRLGSQQGSAGAAAPSNRSAAGPGDVNAPIIFEPSPQLTGGTPQVWAVVSGAAKFWGGCNVLASIDGVNYVSIGTINKTARQGLLTTTLPSHADPDTTNAFSVSMAESNTALDASVTHQDADTFQTLAIVDAEIVAYGHVVLVSGSTYHVSYLRRGLYGTAPASHSIGGAFGCLDDSRVFKFDLPAQWVGQTLHFKFQSFNTFGLALEDPSLCTVYTYVPVGTGYSIAAPTSPALAAFTQVGTSIQDLAFTWVASVGPLLGSYEVQFSTDGGSTWSFDQIVGSSLVAYAYGPVVGSTTYQARVRAISQNGLAVSAWATSNTVTISGSSTASNIWAPSVSLFGRGPDAGEKLFDIALAYAATLPANLTGSTGGCDVAPTSDAVFTLLKNGSSIGTATLPSGLSGRNVATFIFASPVSFAADDDFTFTAPSPQNPTLMGPRFTFLGSR